MANRESSYKPILILGFFLFKLNSMPDVGLQPQLQDQESLLYWLSQPDTPFVGFSNGGQVHICSRKNVGIGKQYIRPDKYWEEVLKTNYEDLCCT